MTFSGPRGGNVLPAFFLPAGTHACTTELCAFSEDYGGFRDATTEVLPIGAASSPTLRE